MIYRLLRAFTDFEDDEDPEADRPYKNEMLERSQNPRLLSEAESRRIHVRTKKRPRPIDFIDSLMFGIGVFLDSVYEVFRPQ